MTTVPPVAPGIWRHWKGHLYQVFFTCHLTPTRWTGTHLFDAQWSSNNLYEGTAMAVVAVAPVGTRPRIVAYPTGNDGPWTCDGKAGVVYMGLTLDGDPRPGHRVRVCDIPHWTATVTADADGGTTVRRFSYLAESWHPDLTAALR